jgi:hypothetical protein
MFVLIAAGLATLAGGAWRAGTPPPLPRIAVGPLFDPGRTLYAKAGSAICASIQELLLHERGGHAADCLVLNGDVEVYPDPLPPGASWVFRIRFLLPSGEVGIGWADYAALGN